MWRAWAASVIALLTGCGTGKAGIEPFAVKTNDGIAHKLYAKVSLEAFLKQLPSGSIDTIDIVSTEGSQAFVLVVVPEESARLQFETTFETQEGEKLVKEWKAAEGRRSGAVTGLFVLPGNIVDATTKTKPVPDPDSN